MYFGKNTLKSTSRHHDMSRSLSFTTLCLVFVFGVLCIAGENEECECKFNEERNVNELLCANKSLSTMPNLTSYECDYNKIDISYNYIMHVGNETFSQALQVRIVIMHMDGIRSIDDNAFYELQNLEKIDLSDNLLNYIHPYVFANNHNLEKVILSNNPLFKISHTTSILNSPSITHLELYRCDLRSINKKMFFNLRNLKHLNLSANKLKSIPLDTFSGLHSLSIVVINHNDWPCDCNSQTLRDFVETLRAKTSALDKPQRPVRCYKENGKGLKTISAPSKLLDCDGQAKYCSSIECEVSVHSEKLIQPTTEFTTQSSAITTDCIDEDTGCAPGDCLTIQYSTPYVILFGGAFITIILTVLFFIVKCCQKGLCCSTRTNKSLSKCNLISQYNHNIRMTKEQNMRHAKFSSKERLISTSSVSSDNDLPIAVYMDQLGGLPECPSTRINVYDRIQTMDVNALPE